MKLKVRSSFTCHSRTFSKNLQELISVPEPTCPRAYHNLKRAAETTDWDIQTPNLDSADDKYLTIDDLRFVGIWNPQLGKPQYTAYGTVVLHLVVFGDNGPREFDEEDSSY